MTTINKGLNEPELRSLNWGTPLNENAGWIDQSLGSSVTIDVTGVSSAPVTLGIEEYRPRAIIFSGALLNDVNYRVPAGVGGEWVVINDTSGSFSVSFGSAAGGAICTIPQGSQSLVYMDGTSGVGAINPDGAKFTFGSREEVELSIISAEVNFIQVGDLFYYRDGSGTALQSKDGQTWSPLGEATLAHWGAVGTPANSAPTTSPYMAEPTANEGAVIQQAFDWAVSRGTTMNGDPELVYGTTFPLVFGARNGGTAKNGAILRFFNVRAMTGTWSTGNQTGDDPNAWTYGDAVLTVGKALSAGGAGKPRIGIENCRVDAARIAPVAVRWMGAAATLQISVVGERGTEADLFCGYPGDATTVANLDGWSNTDSTFIECEGQSFKYTERSDGTFGADNGTGWWGLSGRTSHGIVVRNSDQSFLNCTLSTGLHSLILGKGFSNNFQGCKFWMGDARNETTSKTSIITDGAEKYSFDACTFQDGRNSFYSFVGKADGCKFEQFVHGSVELVASVAGETASQFIFTNNTTDEDGAIMSVTGSGSWGDFGGALMGNQKSTGEAFAIQSKIMVAGGFEFWSGGRIKVPSLTFVPVASTPGRAGEIQFATDGNIYLYTGTVWRRFTGSDVV